MKIIKNKEINYAIFLIKVEIAHFMSGYDHYFEREDAIISITSGRKWRGAHTRKMYKEDM